MITLVVLTVLLVLIFVVDILLRLSKTHKSLTKLKAEYEPNKALLEYYKAYSTYLLLEIVALQRHIVWLESRDSNNEE